METCERCGAAVDDEDFEYAGRTHALGGVPEEAGRVFAGVGKNEHLCRSCRDEVRLLGASVLLFD